MENKKNIIVIVLALALIFIGLRVSGVDYLGLIKSKIYNSNTDKSIEILDEIKMTKEEVSYTDENASSSRVIVWEALGFEPGFALKVFKEKINNKNVYSTNIVTQEGGLYSGFINTVNGNSFNGNILDIAASSTVSVNLNFINKNCTEPSGDLSTSTLSLKLGNENLIACADRI